MTEGFLGRFRRRRTRRMGTDLLSFFFFFHPNGLGTAPHYASDRYQSHARRGL